MRQVDESYTDPLGNLPERPHTAAKPHPQSQEADNEFNDAELGESLPE